MTRRAFTLIELIVATLIMTIVVVSIYSTFSLGMKAWRKGSEGRNLQKIRISLLKLQKELKSTFLFSMIKFKGISSEMTFPVIVSKEDKDNTYIVNYYIVEDRNMGVKSLIKKKILFTDKEYAETGEIGEFIFSAYSMDFEYAYELKNGSKGFEWHGAWEESQKAIPCAVRINFSLDAGGELYHKTIFIPQGVLGT
ncbi:MAG: prepilin-type N-terminal cleavage/methylation domain-containing protein [Candidatus Omnitrophica bacterium]|nr:prepilin-type N-terminal cleavage/methylation domain-containing protein [Candidatus Omnitrophota bacterium]